VAAPENNPEGATPVVGAVAGKVVGAVKGVLGRNGTPADADPLGALEPGTKVAIRPATSGQQRVASIGEDKTTEGTVIDINRRTSVIVVRLPDRTTQELRLDERTESDRPRDTSSSPDVGARVTVSYVDTHGDRVQYFFRKVS
jgi:hypothetical protein